MKARDAWDKVREVAGGLRLEDLPIKAQKFYSLATVKAPFDVAMPRLIDYYRVSGGLEEMLIEQPAEDKLKPKGKEKENGTRKRNL